MRIYFLAVLLSVVFTPQIFAQDETKITGFKIKNPEQNTNYGELVINVGDREKMISDFSDEAWIVANGQEIVFTGADGQGGYENEGQSLWIYNAATGQKRKILSHYYTIDAFGEKTLSSGKRVFLVRMIDGGKGASYLSVVDPERGEVFFRAEAVIHEIKGDKVYLGFYKFWDEMWDEEDYEKLVVERKTFKPYKTETFDLKSVVKNDVIFNENVYEVFYLSDTPDIEKLKRVKIYLWRANDVIPGRNFILAPVNRYVNPQAPLKPALDALFGEIRKDEIDYGFSSSTFGLKFEGVSLKNGIALIKISQSPDNRNYGTLAPFIFSDAVKKTAVQFPTVKKVKVCAVGEVFIDSQLEKPFPACSKM